MTVAYNPLQDIFRKAHCNTLFRRGGSDRRTYRMIFAEMLKSAWADFRRAQQAKKDWRIRQQLREESNTGLPLGSIYVDRSRSYYTRSTRSIASIGQ